MVCMMEMMVVVVSVEQRVMSDVALLMYSTQVSPVVSGITLHTQSMIQLLLTAARARDATFIYYVCVSI